MSSTVSESGSDKILFQKKSVERDNYDLDDAEFVKMYDRTTAKSLNKTHNSGINDSSSLAPQQGDRKWKVGDQCMAPYEADGKWYPAQIEEISVGKKACTVSYIGYEQKAILKLEDLLAQAEVSANYSRFQHQSTDCNWSQYFRSLQTLSISEQMPPTKRRRLSIKQPPNLCFKQRKVSMKQRNVSSADMCGFFKVPDIPQHILEGKQRRLWGKSERRDCRHDNFYGKRPNAAPPNSTNYFAYLRFFFRAVPPLPPIGTRPINSMYKRTIAAEDQFFASSAPFSTELTDSLAVFLFERLNSQANIMHTPSTDYSKIPNLASENSSTVNLYLEGIRERLKSEIDSDVEAAEDAADQEAEETSAATKIADSVKKDTFPIPDLCPPPPPSMFGKIAVAGNEKEALTNMLMSWYMSGYHTGFYQGVMHEKTSHQKPK